MSNKEAIIHATVELIREKGERLDEITMREISQRAGVGLGLINYHFGNKDALIEECVELMVNKTVDFFLTIQEQTDNMTPFENLDHLGNMTLDFLFDHYSISKVSMLSDLGRPGENDNTHRTYEAYVPLVAACRPDWDEFTVRRKTFVLISMMQHAFLRYREILEIQGVDLTDKKERRRFHAQMLHDILGV